MVNSADTASASALVNSNTTFVVKPIVHSENLNTDNGLQFSSVPVNSVNANISLVNDNVLYSNTYKTAPWEHLLSVKNLTFQKNLKDRRVFNTDTSVSKATSIDFSKPSFHVKEYKNSENNTILILVLSSFILLAWIKFSFGKYISQLLRATFNYSDAYKLYRDYNTLIERVYWVLNIIFTLAGGLFCYHLLKYFKLFANLKFTNS